MGGGKNKLLWITLTLPAQAGRFIIFGAHIPRPICQ